MEEDWDAEEEAAMDVLRELEDQAPNNIFESKSARPVSAQNIFKPLLGNLTSENGQPHRVSRDFTSTGPSLQSPLLTMNQPALGNLSIQKKRKRNILGQNDADALEAASDQGATPKSKKPTKAAFSFSDSDEEDEALIIQDAQQNSNLPFELSEEMEDRLLNPASGQSIASLQSSDINKTGIFFEDEDEFPLRPAQKPRSPRELLDYDFALLPNSTSNSRPISALDTTTITTATPAATTSRSALSSRWGVCIPVAQESVFQASTHDFSQIPVNSFGFAKAISSNGTYLYFPKKKNVALAPISSSSSGPLLSDRISKLMDAVKEKIRFNESMARNKTDLALETFLDEDVKEVHKKEKRLWVDKYAPKLYMELVGDEQINRTVLSWVKSWDFCVFGKEHKRSAEPVLDRFSSSKNAHVVPDKKKRPEKKILLLSGPPGLGKTTLAHVIAKHAGYRVLEFNASADNSGKPFKTLIAPAIDSQAAFGMPNLVIIDEIDGVSSMGGDESFIANLVAMAQGVSTKKRSKFSKGNSNKESKPRGLIRPIICICNDPHATALRPLLAVSLHIALRLPAFQLLANRLQDICKWEGMQSNLQSMMSLCELSQGDMRSAINTLQFLKQKSNTVSQKEIEGLTIGNKDISYGWSKVCHAIFEKPPSNGSRMQKERFRKSDETDDFIARISQLVHGFGDYAHIMQACFENYLNTKLFDVTALNSNVESRFVQQSHHILFFDALQKKVETEHAYELQAYLVFPVANFYRLFATSKQATIEFPATTYQVNNVTKQVRSLVTVFWDGCNLYMKSNWFNKTNIILELAPMLMYIISPSFKPVNVQILKPNERKMLDRLVNILVSFGLTMSKETSEKNEIEFALDPPINLLVDLYPFCSARRTISDLSYSANQMIAHECELLKVRISSGLLVKKPLNAPSESSSAFAASSKPLTSGKFTINPVRPTERTVQLEDLIPASITLAPEKPVRDFFGRIIAKPSVPTLNADGKENSSASNGKGNRNREASILKAAKEDGKAKRLAKFKNPAVSFKFNEGYSNAVRKPLFLGDIL